VNLRAPMSVALGKGAAGGAAQHWWLQRVTAIALVPLTIWFVWSLASLPAFDYVTVRGWVSGGWSPIWLALLVVAACWHSLLGVQVVIEDYVHGKAAKTGALLLSSFLHVVAGMASLFALLKTALL
jgi:succinate dehydrogenase / fumarate reductase membrane anchor subunit